MATSILVVDSEPTVRDVVTTILRTAGYDVRATGDFDAAVHMMRTAAPDLLITNVYLKGITGHDALRRLRHEFPHLCIIMASGLPDSDVIQRWMGEERFDVFPKPFTADDLRRKVEQVLSDRVTGASG